MMVTISKWGNSMGIRIPSVILTALNIQEGDKLSYDLDGDRIVLRKAQSTADIFESYYGKTFNEITASDIGDGEELDWGADIGGECI